MINPINRLLLIIPSDLKSPQYIKRMFASIDVSTSVDVVVINQNDKDPLSDYAQLHTANLIKEIQTKGLVPLSKARNLALEWVYENYDKDINSVLTMFVDDDAWFPQDTIDFLLSVERRAYALKTIDPDINKSFIHSQSGENEIKGSHLITDICSICLVVPLENLKKQNLFFYEKIGLGNKISQGEESLFIYSLHSFGVKIYGSNYLIFHPYKKTFSEKNFYSLAYFFAWGSRFVSSKLFFSPCLKNIVKYTVALLFSFKDKRYAALFKKVWLGTIDGLKNAEELVYQK